MQKLQKKRESRSSTIKTMTVDEIYDQNERVKPLIDQLEQKEDLSQNETHIENENNKNKNKNKNSSSTNKQTSDKHTQLDSHAPTSKSLPSQTAAEFLKNEGSARIFTVPQLTATHGDASDDVFLCFF